MADTVKAKRAPQPPRPFFMAYSVNEDGTDIEVHSFSRDTMALVTAMQDHPGCKVKPLTAPPGAPRKAKGS